MTEYIKREQISGLYRIYRRNDLYLCASSEMIHVPVCLFVYFLLCFKFTVQPSKVIMNMYMFSGLRPSLLHLGNASQAKAIMNMCVFSGSLGSPTPPCYKSKL